MDKKTTTGVPEIDQLIGGVIPGDNIVWEVDSGSSFENIVSSFLTACDKESTPVVYISFNRSPQTIVSKYVGFMSKGRFTLVDCFTSGKGNKDEMFLEFFRTLSDKPGHGPIHIQDPMDFSSLAEVLINLRFEGNRGPKYVFDSLTGMLDLWGDEDRAIRFFGHLCPRLYDLDTIAYWLLEKDAHSNAFLAKIRHITQVVLEVALSEGLQTLTVKKAANRHCEDVGVSRRFDVESDRVLLTWESREGRELSLLTRMGEALGSALEPRSFFEQTIETLASELGMIRGTLVLLDRTSDKLKIAAAHGLSSKERARGEYFIGEGITGQVAKSGVPEIVPDIHADPRFLDRTSARSADAKTPIAFICVPLVVDREIVGALSVDRPFASELILKKDLRLLSIVASVVSQVLKINRIIQVEKEEILAQDGERLQELSRRYRMDNVIGESEAITSVLSTAATAAKSRASILITGETGTGKELVANVLHYNSDRSSGPFIKVNCGALPEELLESELFGHVKGAFTGALNDNKGRFEIADKGTLFLDEIGEMSPRLQVKLLRVLQEGEFEPVGSTNTISVNVRVVAATSKDMKEQIKQGHFRGDLYYRLNVIPIHLPSLRERREDIPLLVNHFLDKYNKENDRKVTKLSREVIDYLLAYPWPGNIRELENCVERAVVMSPGKTFSANMLPDEIISYKRSSAVVPKLASAHVADVGHIVDAFLRKSTDLSRVRRELVDAVEEAVIRKALDTPGISQRELSKKLGISRVTLRKKLKQYGIG